MANEKVKAKSGMQGKTSQTERWGPRAEIKYAARKKRRQEDRQAKREDF